jgi:hypothetical protein
VTIRGRYQFQILPAESELLAAISTAAGQAAQNAQFFAQSLRAIDRISMNVMQGSGDTYL